MGAAIATRRDTFAQLGGFDEKFFVYYEDIDLCVRGGHAGVPSIVDGDSQWTHGWARESTGLNWRGWKLEVASAFRFYRKHPRFLVGRA
ncbi:hypothetical protein AYL44_10685 [Microbacterium oleivorans]|uniref:Glycosyltransferase n=2 Tax=Microbacterium oleivorans TaxID=273677 RepID=A0A177K7E9_9MICO|nr:hypothetical protein AYL44_10685 [Microbacterium oleivorans]